MTLRIASYNLHKCKGTDRRRDAGRIIDVLNTLDADVVALQEVDHRLGDRPEALPRRLVEEMTDFDDAGFATGAQSLGWHGQTLLVRSGLEVRRTLRIDLPALEPRGAVMAEIGAGARSLRVVGVHLALLRRYRLRQLQTIRDLVSRMPQMPTVILGDFNEWSEDRGLDPLDEDFAVCAPGRSFHATQPVAALDRVALGAGVTLAGAGVAETGLARLASDHLPIWADVEVAAPG